MVAYGKEKGISYDICYAPDLVLLVVDGSSWFRIKYYHVYISVSFFVMLRHSRFPLPGDHCGKLQ